MSTELRRKDVKSLVQQGRAQLVEVLPAGEFTREHLPGAINLPLSELTAESAKQLKKDQALIVYSADYTCDVSARAASRLESMGFQEVYRYTAGKADWIGAGFDTQGDEAKKPRIKQSLNRNVLTCTPKERLSSIKNRKPESTDICVVVNDRNVVLGAIEGKGWDADPLKTAAQVMDPAPTTVRPSKDPTETLREMRKSETEHLIVTTSDGELLGILERPDKKTKAA